MSYYDIYKEMIFEFSVLNKLGLSKKREMKGCEQIDIKPLLEKYKGGGTNSYYHPRMILKVLVYAYAEKLYSSRQIAKALRENVNFMWLSSGNRPDFRTIDNFRGSFDKQNFNSTRETNLRSAICWVVFDELDLVWSAGYFLTQKHFLK